MPEIWSVVNSGESYLDVLFADITYASVNPFFFYFKVLRVLEKTVANMWLNETTMFVGDMRRHHMKNV